MRIGGLQKLSMVDWPGKLCCTVFTAGCALRCPFCHNPSLVLPERFPPDYTAEAVLAFLDKRRGLLEGVCVSGGEPLQQPELPELLGDIKGMGFGVKLDTNGLYPERLRAAVEAGLVDYVAMDIKNSPERYAETVGIPGFDLMRVRESAAYLLTGAVDYEFRTTLVRELHSPQDISAMGRWLAGAKRFRLQGFVDSGELLGGIPLHAFNETEMDAFRKQLDLKYTVLIPPL